MEEAPERTQWSDSGWQKKFYVKNKAAAEQQLTQEQLIREAQDRSDKMSVLPRQEIEGDDELQQYCSRKRKDFESALQMNKHIMGEWVKYQNFEQSMKDFTR